MAYKAVRNRVWLPFGLLSIYSDMQINCFLIQAKSFL